MRIFFREIWQLCLRFRISTVFIVGSSGLLVRLFDVSVRGLRDARSWGDFCVIFDLGLAIPAGMGRAWKRGKVSGGGIVRLWQREVGDLTPHTFKHRVRASEDFVLRLGIHNRLEKHRGCVNTVTFNSEGDILVSGSDDRMVILWDWELGRSKLIFHSGHTNNVFQAKIIPYTDNRSLITCAADGEVRHAQILEGGRVDTKLLAKHEGRAHKLAFDPSSPHIFYSCGEDGLVQHFDLRAQSATPLFTCKSLRGRRCPLLGTVHLNAIAVDPRNSNLFAVAGSDEYSRLYDIRKYNWARLSNVNGPVDCFCPDHLIGDDQVGITGLAFSTCSELLVSYNDELIYLFPKDQGLGSEPGSSGLGSSSSQTTELDTGFKPGPQAYSGHQNCDTVKGVNFFGPSCEYVVSGSDCGRIFIWRKKDGELLRAMEADKHVVNCIEPHPHSTVLASSGIEDDIKLWIPNSSEPLPPVNVEEDLTADGIACFALDGFGPDDTDDDDDRGVDFDSNVELDSDDGMASDSASSWEEKPSPRPSP
ncbi:uncharacterized protein LOC144716843 isoform X2 [Wolffia australiana]